MVYLLVYLDRHVNKQVEQKVIFGHSLIVLAIQNCATTIAFSVRILVTSGSNTLHTLTIDNFRLLIRLFLCTLLIVF